MKWTTQTPTEEQWYWKREKSGKKWGYTECVRVFRRECGDWAYYETENKESFGVVPQNTKIEWSGPSQNQRIK